MEDAWSWVVLLTALILESGTKITLIVVDFYVLNRAIPFVLLLNVKCSNDYATSRSYARKPPFDHFNLTSSD